MTYQADFLTNRYARIAAQSGATDMHLLALALCAIDGQRTERQGQPMTDGHLRQEAAEIVRAARDSAVDDEERFQAERRNCNSPKG